MIEERRLHEFAFDLLQVHFLLCAETREGCHRVLFKKPRVVLENILHEVADYDFLFYFVGQRSEKIIPCPRQSVIAPVVVHVLYYLVN